MMDLRIVCTSDLHLGCTSLLQQAPPEVQQAWVDEGLRIFREIGEHALRTGADFLIVCGDVFHILRPSGYVFHGFAKVIGELCSQGVQVIVLAGNHDMPRVSGAEPYLSALQAVRVPGFHFVREPALLTLEGSRSGRRVSFFCFPYTHFLDPSELAEKISEFIDSSAPGRGDFNIFLGHLVVEGSSLGVLRELLPYPESVVPKRVLLQENIDLVLLGHLHGHQVISGRILYPGSPLRVSFLEEGEPKGFLEITVAEGQVAHRFIQTDAPPLLTYPSDEYLDLSGSADPTRKLLEMLEGLKPPSSAVVRLRVKMSPKQQLLWYKVVEQVRSQGALFAVLEMVREKRAGELRLGAPASLENLLEAFVDQSLRGRVPPKLLSLIKQEGRRIIEEVRERQ